MPTILIDGKMLLNMCIDNGIGFSYKPVFKQETIKNILQLSSPQNANIVDCNENNEYIVEREITANDIRARILIVPQIIKNTIDCSAVSMVLEINGQNKELNLDKSHRYFGGITQVYKECGLINKDKTYIKKRSKWKIDNGKIIVVIEQQKQLCLQISIQNTKYYTPKSFYSDFGVFFILLQFIVEMYLKHIEKNVVIC